MPGSITKLIAKVFINGVVTEYMAKHKFRSYVYILSRERDLLMNLHCIRTPVPTFLANRSL
jgi:hypothetical protein